MARRFDPRSVVALFAVSAALGLGSVSFAAEPAPQPVRLDWVRGPSLAPIGADLAEMQISEDYVYLDADGTKRLMELTQNPVSGLEMAAVAPVSGEAGWFLVFEFEKVGYVPDDEKDSLDPDAMLATIRQSTEAANEERRARGWGTMQIVGWHETPHYDTRTNNLRWAITGESDGQRNINRIVKLLGRRGAMTVTLVSSPDELVAAIPAVETLLAGYRFKPGHTYAEYVPGTDQLASYGLTALVVGGAGAALVKSGLLAKLWKPIAIGLVALGAGIKRLLTSGRKVQTSLEGKIG